jgi:RNA-splicing ligase RtcB
MGQYPYAGFAEHKEPLIGARHTLEDISSRRTPSKYLERALEAPKVAKQLGSLGGGNHFLEVCQGYSIVAQQK